MSFATTVIAIPRARRLDTTIEELQQQQQFSKVSASEAEFRQLIGEAADITPMVEDAYFGVPA